MNDLHKEVKELLLSRTLTLKGISKSHKISLPTLNKIKKGEKVSDKSLIYLKEILK